MTTNLKDTLKLGYSARVGSNIVHYPTFPRGMTVTGFHSASNTGWGSTGHKRGRSLKGTPEYVTLVKYYEELYDTEHSMPRTNNDRR